MPVSKHRKKSKQNSFGLRKAQRQKDAMEAMVRRRAAHRDEMRELEAMMLKQNIINMSKQVADISSKVESEVAQNEETK